MGGDEFVLFLPGIRRREDAAEIAKKLVEALQHQFCLQGNCVDITVSIGIAIYPDDGADSNTLLHNADVALYEAKKCGRNNYQHYSARVNYLHQADTMV
jgi:diguanylate cyclase (GGDEF)-like protein